MREQYLTEAPACFIDRSRRQATKQAQKAVLKTHRKQ